MSHRGELTERIVRILILLAERPRSQRELKSEFKVDSITIRRNLRDISFHYPIVEERESREVIYRFADWYQFKPPNLTPAELSALLLAQNSISAFNSAHFGTPFAKYGRTLIDKVRAALPQALRDYLDTLSNIFGTAAVPAKDYTPHAETIDQLTKAATNCRRLKLRYHNLHDDTVKDRFFDPYAIYFDPDGATLKTIGYDHASKGIRLFSIDRIQSLSETGESFIRPIFNLQDYLTENCFNGIHGEPLTVRLKAYDVTARIFAERQFHPSQKTIEQTPRTEADPETITIEMRVARGRGLERFILSWTPQIEVLEPKELREKVNEELHKGLAQNGGT